MQKFPYPAHLYLTDDGTQDGEKNANGTYASVTPFWLTPVGADILSIERMLVEVEDTNGMTAAEYGNLGAALTNGITVQIIASDGSTVISDLTQGVPIKTNAAWRRYCFDVAVDAWGGAAPVNDVLSVRWTFAKSGVPLILKAGQRLQVNLHDTLTGLIAHYFGIQGHYLNRGM